MNQEIYVKEMPKSCLWCKFFAQDRRQCEIELGFEWSEKKFKFNDCPLIDIKTHDRELVKEVCEKIRKNYSKFDSYDDFDWFGFENFLDQLQKEFEK